MIVNLGGDVRDLFLADVTAEAHNACQKGFVGGATAQMFGLPVRKFLEKVRGVIDRRQDFQQRNVGAGRKEGSERGFVVFFFLLFWRGHVKRLIRTKFEQWILPGQDTLIRSAILFFQRAPQFP